jgi:NAD(P)-dependent dehydrogenase (short-subunit alcohol dehydrogenase family)
MGWSSADIPDLSGRVAIVTGATSGIGREAARALAAHGAEVILAVRDPARGAALARELGPRARVEALDLADLASVRAFAQRIETVNLLLNNAGLGMQPRRETTRDGFELQIGTNHLGHFALTGLLVPALLRATAPRVVTIASVAHNRGRIDFDDLMSERHYSGRAVYSQSKLANLMFARELARRAEAQGSVLTSLAAHPGLASTGFMRATKLPAPVMALGSVVMGVLGQSAARGALPGLYALTMPDARNGEYWGPDGVMEARGLPARAKVAPQARDEAAAARLWEVSERLTGVVFPPLA